MFPELDQVLVITKMKSPTIIEGTSVTSNQLNLIYLTPATVILGSVVRTVGKTSELDKTTAPDNAFELIVVLDGTALTSEAFNVIGPDNAFELTVVVLSTFKFNELLVVC
jgi:hypothetical protein